MKLELEKFLKRHKNWESLLTAPPYSLKITRDGEYVMFKYLQYASDLSLKICQEARGIIFHEPTRRPVCVPFFKFFNYGEKEAAVIDWNAPITVTEKIDGSLIKIWFHNGSWHISTNGTIDAYKAIVGDDNKTFGDLFEEALGVSFTKFAGLKLYGLDFFRFHLDIECTYMFELVHPENELVVQYAEKKVYFLAARNNRTYEEVPVKTPILLTMPPKEYRLRNIEDILSIVRKMNEHHEGVVIRDVHGNRIKVKSPLYLLKARAFNNGVLTDKRILSMYRADVLDDFLGYAPSKKDQVDETLAILSSYVNRQEALYQKIKDIHDRKQIADTILKAGGDISYVMGRLDGFFKEPLEYFHSFIYLRAALRILKKERNTSKTNKPNT